MSALILPPSLHGDILSTAGIFKADLQKLYGDGVLMCSVCAGAFLLAEAGLLDGRTATTHWDLANQFESSYPDVELNVERMLVDDGDLITAGGVMAWIDLGLKLVDRFLGPAIMLKTAKFLLVDPGEREQRFYSVFSPSLSHGDSAVLKVQQWLQSGFAEAVTVKEMTEFSGLSGRTFIRRFQQATGFSPSEYLQHLRIGKARELMELTSQSVDQIAWQVGYQDPGAFRRIFHKVMGLTPRDYRARFAISSGA
ncbi:helix-turn-helix domain-containing protein [Kordiimonas sp. SCSIO 12603]|uniref:GlxA family transcriptional regulator n=1 Tax=Kordiimonas sp. SCSIO 12603 TaxID=2829596 RepID=UPI002105A3C5|nr:helix-turn-helix domain-containing protein [Kordiimonas sp. SCSIO 12603]UTW58815.1 helix-turn-helix domain-containing protein [Kordiimonas sp. SCSIO 12603]